MRGIIDRFEGDLVVVEIGNETKDFNKDIFPKNASVGDIVEIKGEHVTVLKEETDIRRKEIENLMNDLFE
ncbi:DUF3006 domain-containing protein [Bacillus sp. ISL-40]|uniref:DUF3006 domain-containing protein n=1 Tax=unclassified Bacillus (in: firmicutes) TaxID=185979 RepID=UPI001BEACA5D|nr:MULTISPECIES: DUF3006 domain-containing protein [unclassified Bacillus (in: firmicutes)]MBT2701382.1 DUF3006 domain-containing protein [Bacillus sp. ISL-40]MBT2743334.1 DUF3006 domain-containing protein [Bacillus sp. ISL-77]